MSWSRALAAAGLADAFKAADDGTTNIFPSPPMTLNPPAIVVGRPLEVRYAEAGLGVDAVELPVICLGPMEGDDVVDALITFVRSVVMADPSVGRTLRSTSPSLQRNWRAVRIGGADYLAADVVLNIEM